MDSVHKMCTIIENIGKNAIKESPQKGENSGRTERTRNMPGCWNAEGDGFRGMENAAVAA